MPDARSSLGAQLLSRVRSQFPDWRGVDTPHFVREELQYKRDAAAFASDTLARKKLEVAIRSRDWNGLRDTFRRVAGKTNLMFLGVPSSGDLAALNHDHQDPAGFFTQLLTLLYGPKATHQRITDFSSYLEENAIPNKWSFATYFLFLLHPEREVYVRPTETKWLLDLAGIRSWQSRPNGETYADLTKLYRQLLEEFKDQGAKDMIDVQSIVWAAANAPDGLVSPTRLQDLKHLLGRFAETYVRSEESQRLFSRYEPTRLEGRRAFEGIAERHEKGEPIAQDVLRLLLPHRDTEANRANRRWIHWTPVFKGDAARFFEIARGVEAGQWPNIASRIVEFVSGMIAEGADTVGLCEEFSGTWESHGFGSGSLSPILNAVRPDRFRIVNSPTAITLSWMTEIEADDRYTADIEYYAETSHDLNQVIEELRPIAEHLVPEGHQLEDFVDQFCHWLPQQDLSLVRYWKIAPGDNAWQWEECRSAGFIAVGWAELGDLTSVTTRKQYEKRLEKARVQYPDLTDDGPYQAVRFAHEIQDGDIVIANRGTSEVLGIGRVTGPYMYVPGGPHPNRRPVDWFDTTPRRVSQGGWRRTLIQLSAEDYKAIVGGPALDTGPLFTDRARELLHTLAAAPVAATYERIQTELERFVVEPMHRLLRGVIDGLPPEMIQPLETQDGLFSRFRKNDYGKGGIWPHYWGAIFPSGLTKITGPQLAIRIDPKGFGFGFYYGHQAEGVPTAAHERLVANAEAVRQALQHSSNLGLEIGLSLDDSGNTVTPDEWISKVSDRPPPVSRRISWEDLATLPHDELQRMVAEGFTALSPIMDLFTGRSGPPQVREPLASEGFTVEDLAREMSISVDEARRWGRLAERRRQLVFYGPPGTGKTYAARLLARHLTQGSDGISEILQFHPSYGYEEFIEGIRPKAAAGGLDYPVVDGRFLEFCQKARSRRGRCVMIIDEINRANLARVFGELMYSLEYRDQPVRFSLSGRDFTIPGNVILIGTMNTADRSIALVDFALRRRFAFVNLEPRLDLLEGWHSKKGRDVTSLIEVLREINKDIGSPQYALGISFFLTDQLPRLLEDVWTTDIWPYLEEYFFDRPEIAEKYAWGNVRDRLSMS